MAGENVSDRVNELERALFVATEDGKRLARELELARDALRVMTYERDDWRDRAQRNRDEARELEGTLAAERKASAAEIARLQASAFPADRQPPDVATLDAAEARFALLELDEGG